MLENGEIFKLIKLYTRKTKKHQIPYERFVTFIQTYSARHQEERPELKILAENTASALKSELEELTAEDKIVIEYSEGIPVRINYPNFFLDTINGEYKKIIANHHIPFPSEESFLPIRFPKEYLKTINVRESFTEWLRNPESFEDDSILKLEFPEGYKSLLITAGILKKDLLELAVGKIRAYLGTRRNVNYIQNKFVGKFGQKDVLLKDMVEGIMSNHIKSIGQIKAPNDFSFRFWTTLANFIIQEYKPKPSIQPEEYSICQASFLIGFYLVHSKSLTTQKKEAEEALKVLQKSLLKPPYFFTVSDLYNLKDSKGALLTRKYSKEDLHSFLSEKTKKQEGKEIPEIIRLDAPNKKQYFIHKEVILPLCAKRIELLTSAYRVEYVDAWTGILKELKKSDVMTDDDAFIADLEEKVKVGDPLLFSMLNFDILFLTKEDVPPANAIAFQINRLFDLNKKSLIPFDGILKLDRDELYQEARRRLPVWQLMPIIGPILIFFKRLFKKSATTRVVEKRGDLRSLLESPPKKQYTPRAGFRKVSETTETIKEVEKPEKQEKSGQTAKARLAVFRKSIAALTLDVVGSGRSVDASLKELAERWNPIFDEKARINLTEDVNSMVRDFVRGLKRRGLIKAPDAEGLTTMAERLAANKVFDEIKRKEDFKQYIKIYLLKLFGKE